MKDVLLVEDNPADVYLIRRVVEDCGPDLHLSVVPDGKNIRTALRTAADGAPLLELYDPYMRRRAAFGLDAGDQPGLSLEDTAGKARLTLGLEHEGLAVLRFLNQEQVARIGLSLGAGGGPASLSFLDSGGKIRAMLALGSEGGPVLTFLDEAGQRIWRAPEQ